MANFMNASRILLFLLFCTVNYLPVLAEETARISGIVHFENSLTFPNPPTGTTSITVIDADGMVHPVLISGVDIYSGNRGKIIFSIELEVPLFEYCTIRFDKDKELPLYLEPGYDIEIEVEMYNFYGSATYRGKGFRPSEYLLKSRARFYNSSILEFYWPLSAELTVEEFPQFIYQKEKKELQFLSENKSVLPNSFSRRHRRNIISGFEACKIAFLQRYIERENKSRDEAIQDFPQKFFQSDGKHFLLFKAQAYLLPNFHEYLERKAELDIQTQTQLAKYSDYGRESFDYYTHRYTDQYSQTYLQYNLVKRLIQANEIEQGMDLFHELMEIKEKKAELGFFDRSKKEIEVLYKRMDRYYEFAESMLDGNPFSDMIFTDAANRVYHLNEFTDRPKIFFLSYYDSSPEELERSVDIYEAYSHLIETYHDDISLLTVNVHERQLDKNNMRNSPIKSQYHIFLNSNPNPYYPELMKLIHNRSCLVAADGEFIEMDPGIEEIEEYLNDLDGESTDWEEDIEPIIVGVLVGLFTALLLGTIPWLRRKYLQKKEEERRRWTELELKAIRSQLNPHFLFNTMSSIQSLISSENPETASEHLAGLADLMRMVLKHSEKGIISLAEELEAAEKYCELEALRFNFEYEIEVSPEIDPFLVEVPAMVIQPYIENAILHGISTNTSNLEPSKISIQVNKVGGSMQIMVEDNGVGIQKTLALPSTGNGMGMKLNRERLSLLNHKSGGVQIIDRSELGTGETGTRVEVWLPLEGE